MHTPAARKLVNVAVHMLGQSMAFGVRRSGAHPSSARQVQLPHEEEEGTPCALPPNDASSSSAFTDKQ